MTLKHRRQFTREFKFQVLAEIAAGKSVAQAAREYQLHPTLIGRWQKQHRQYADRAFAGNGRAYTDEARIAELERMVGRYVLFALKHRSPCPLSLCLRGIERFFKLLAVVR